MGPNGTGGLGGLSWDTCGQVTVACSVSEEAHACHPHAAHISEETGGRVSFADVSQQLKVRNLLRG